MTYDDWLKSHCPAHLKPASSHESRQMRAVLACSRRETKMEDAAIVGSLAERPFDNEPEFSAILTAEAEILGSMK